MIATPPSADRAGGNEIAAIIAFLIAAAISIEVTRIAGNVSLVWPANALAAALLVRDGRILSWSAAFGLWCVGTLVNVGLAADSVPFAGALTAANVFEVWLTTWLLRDVWRHGAPVIDLALARRILLLAGVCAPAVGTVPGAVLVHTFLDIPILTAALTWWQSSVCGAALAAPVVYMFSREGWRTLLAPGNRRFNIAFALICLVVTPLAIRFVDHSFIVVATPLVIAALRMGALGAAALCTLCGVEIVVFWAVGMAPELAAMRPSELVRELPLLPMMLLLVAPVAVGVAVDDRRRAIQAHGASQRRMQQMLEQSPIGMCILTLDGKWELSNAALQKMLGYSAEELHGKQNTELFSSEEFEAGKARALGLLRGDRPSYTNERRFRRSDGQWIWTRCTTSLMREAGGAPARFIVQIESLAEQRRVEHELAIERERLATTLRAIADAVFVADAEGRVTYMNHAAEQFLGKTLSDTAAGNERLQLGVVSLCLARDEFVRRDSPTLLRVADGSTRYFQESASPLHDPDGAINGVVVVLRDVRSEFEREQKLRRDAEQDQLTGLANRRAFEERIAAAVSRCQAGTFATLLIVDLDHFKRINDEAGHQAGDEMLREVAAALRRSTRSSDLIARLGGDEFAIVLDDCAEARARRIAEEILKNILAIRVTWNGVQYSVGASVGGATIGGQPFTANAETTRSWIAAADSACYAAKGVGRGQIRFAETGT
jgi:diguanylate cyclase (GGDEF)-like protein/PAS domain S-box-containing protein